MLQWLDLNNQSNWNAGLNTEVCLSSPLCRLSLPVSAWVQCRSLIRAWLWFALSDQGRGDMGLCDYWTLRLYQFQSFNNSQVSCRALAVIYGRSDHWGYSRVGAIDHQRRICIFHELEYILWFNVRLAQMCWLPSKSSSTELKDMFSSLLKKKRTGLQMHFDI